MKIRDEKTLILFKPDCVRKNLCGTVLQTLQSEGFHVRGMKMMQLNEEILKEHYGHIIDLVIDGEPLFPRLCNFMQSSPVVALVLSGPGVIERVRTILGPTNSMKAEKWTIRGSYGTNSMFNICHASDSLESAAVEIKRFFADDELFDNVF
ncbi:MAG: nucleoside-diphosphate kinase [Akkermansia sp.]